MHICMHICLAQKCAHRWLTVFEHAPISEEVGHAVTVTGMYLEQTLQMPDPIVRSTDWLKKCLIF